MAGICLYAAVGIPQNLQLERLAPVSYRWCCRLAAARCCFTLVHGCRQQLPGTRMILTACLMTLRQVLLCRLSWCHELGMTESVHSVLQNLLLQCSDGIKENAWHSVKAQRTLHLSLSCGDLRRISQIAAGWSTYMTASSAVPAALICDAL